MQRGDEAATHGTLARFPYDHVKMPVNDRTKATKWRGPQNRDSEPAKRNNAQHELPAPSTWSVGDREDDSRGGQRRPGRVMYDPLFSGRSGQVHGRWASAGPGLQNWQVREGRTGTSAAVLCSSSTTRPFPGSPQGGPRLAALRPCSSSVEIPALLFFLLHLGCLLRFRPALGRMYRIRHGHQLQQCSQQQPRRTLQGSVSKGTRPPS